MTRAVRFHQIGGPEVLTIEDVVVGDPGPGELRVRPESVGVNRGETMFREGRYVYPTQPPCWYGAEGSAIVEAVGEGVTGFATGDRVCFMPTFLPGSYGMCGETAIMPAASTLLAPTGLDPVDIAAVWVSYSTAFGLIELSGLSSGDTVLITAASSSVGLAAIQTVRSRGAVPIAVPRTADKADALKKLGAEHVIVSNDHDIVDAVMRITDGAGVSISFDAIAGPMLETLVRATQAEGRILLYGELAGEATPFPLVPAALSGVSIRGFVAPRHIWGRPDRMARCRDFIQGGIDAGWLRPPIARVFPFEQVVEANRFLETNTQIGKVVVTI